ncbi:MAG: PilZ domain-containing protein [Planctomycetota bacterium]
MGTKHTGDEQRRASGRIRVSGVQTDRGVVIDASAGGLRIKGKAPKGAVPGTVMPIRVEGDHYAIEAECEIRWIQKHPIRGSMFGVSFVDLDENDLKTLFVIIRTAGTETRCRWDAA